MEILLSGIENQEDTGILQRAINMLPPSGGTIIITKGRWYSDPIDLKSNVTIELQKDAVLIANADYERYQNGITSTICEDSDRAFILAQNCENITITGKGIIDGQSDQWVRSHDEYEPLGIKTPDIYRPRMIVFEDCCNISLSLFKIINAPMWTVHLTACSRGVIDSLIIDNDMEMPNVDGIDIDACKDIIIKNCQISAADDCICLKTLKRQAQKTKQCHDIDVQNCVLRSNSCAIKIGTETYGDIFDIHIKDCKIINSNRALGVFIRDGAHIHDVIFENITCQSDIKTLGFWGCGEAITITSNIRNTDDYPGVIENIAFKNIQALSYGAINIHGMEDYPLKNIIFEDVAITITAAKDEKRIYDLRPGISENAPSFGRKNSYAYDAQGRIMGIHEYPDHMPAIWAQHVDGLILKNISTNYKKDQDFYQTKMAIQLMPSVTNIFTYDGKGQ